MNTTKTALITGATGFLGTFVALQLVERGGVRYGFLQRTSVYWPTNHEAGDNSPGVAVVRGNTAYQVPAHKTRPGTSV